MSITKRESTYIAYETKICVAALFDIIAAVGKTLIPMVFVIPNISRWLSNDYTTIFFIHIFLTLTRIIIILISRL